MGNDAFKNSDYISILSALVYIFIIGLQVIVSPKLQHFCTAPYKIGSIIEYDSISKDNTKDVLFVTTLR
jgi:hypothetical protein